MITKGYISYENNESVEEDVFTTTLSLEMLITLIKDEIPLLINDCRFKPTEIVQIDLTKNEIAIWGEFI